MQIQITPSEYNIMNNYQILIITGFRVLLAKGFELLPVG